LVETSAEKKDATDLAKAKRSEEKLSPQPPSDAVRKQKKNILEDLFNAVLS